VVKIRMMTVAALTLAAACGGTTPSRDGPAPREPGEGPGEFVGPMPGGVGGGGPNVFALIGARERLGLNGAQVTDLDSIGRAWSVVNDSVQRELRRRGERTPAATVHPLLLRMAENNDAANRAVEALLSEEQRRVACTLPAAQPGRADSRPPVNRPSDRRAGARRQPGDSVPGMRMRRGWPWCASASPSNSGR
jgi:hypothetical protein